MAEVVFKYPLDLRKALENGLRVTVPMPLGAKVIHVALQHGQITMWAQVTLGNVMRDRVYAIVGTGHGEVPANSVHVGTVQMLSDNGDEYVWHIYEETV